MSASAGGKTLDAEGKVTGNNENVTIECENDTVTWTIETTTSAERRFVELTVEVTKDAIVPDDLNVNDDKEHMTGNQANVKYKTDNGADTNTAVNPTPEFSKTEVTPGENERAEVGDEIIYTIHWKDHKVEPATVTIRDVLDPGLDWVDESGNGTYNSSTRTVTWTIEADCYAEGDVTLKVKVNAKAVFGKNGIKVDKDVRDHKVDNPAQMRIGHDPWVDSEIIPNPVSGPHKTETTPGYGMHVNVDDENTCEIRWKDYKYESATVIVRDKLDPGVEFVSADNGGVYDARMRTWSPGSSSIAWRKHPARSR